MLVYYKALKINVLTLFRVKLLIFLAFTLPFSGLSQVNNLGIPNVINYSKYEYNAGTQNWDAAYLKSGKILFANNEGLLIFNGSNWQLLETPKKTILRSFEVSQDEKRIYVGGQDEIGYFDLEDPKLSYVDIKSKLPPGDQSLDDIWEMELIQTGLYFRSRNKIFNVNNKDVKVYPSGPSITFMSDFNDEIYFNELDFGLFRINRNGEKIFVEGSEILINAAIIDLITISDSLGVIVTSASGLYKFDGERISKWPTGADQILRANRVISSTFLEFTNQLALGTEIGGIVIMNLDGRVELKIDKQSGLQNNTVSTITSDKKGNLWLGTYNGIDKIDFASSNPMIYPDGELEGALYDILEWKGHYYFGTNNGLFKLKKQDYYNPLEETKFTFIQNSGGQVWGLDIIDDRLYMGHTLGAFEILQNDIAKEISLQVGAWRFEKLNDDIMVVGTYAGLDFFRRSGQDWEYIKRSEGFNESSRIMSLDKEGFLWVSHPYKGLFRIAFDETKTDIKVDTIGVEHGIEDFTNCYVHEIEDLIFVSTEDKIYKYDYLSNTFNVDKKFMSFFEGQSFKRFIESVNGLWYITDQECGQIQMEHSGLELHLNKKIFVQGDLPLVGGFENLFPLSYDEALICTDKGVMHKLNTPANDEKIYSIINSIGVSDGVMDSILYSGFGEMPQNIKVKFDFNDIRFDYSSDLFEGKASNINYSFRLKEYEEHWSEWLPIRYKEYTNLEPGVYTFQLKAANQGVINGELLEFKFEISHPWYSTIFMKFVYLLLAGLGIILLITLPNRKIMKEKEIILTEKLKTEEKVVDLEKESMHKELDYQNRELANLTMHLLQKSETIKQLKIDVEGIRKKVQDPSLRREMKKVLNKLNSDERLEDDWNRFAFQFDKVHHDFLRRIKVEFPKLSSSDLKLCAYLRLNLSSKEIAPLLNISIRGVEISRYRLRKKLELEKGQNLNTYMISY